MFCVCIQVTVACVQFSFEEFYGASNFKSREFDLKLRAWVVRHKVQLLINRINNKIPDERIYVNFILLKRSGLFSINLKLEQIIISDLAHRNILFVY